MSVLTDRLNSNKYVRFPFVEDATMLDITAAFVLPDNFIADFSATIYGEPAPDCLLTGLSVTAGSVWLTFDVGGQPCILIVPPFISDYYSTSFLSVDGYGDTIIRFTATVTAELEAWAADNPSAAYTFTGIPVEPSCSILRNNHRVMSIAASGQARLSGDVQFREGYNMRVTVLPDFNALNLSAVLGEGAGVPCEPILTSSSSAHACDGLIYHINGLHPDWFGQFFLYGGQGVSVEPEASTHRLILKTNVAGCSSTTCVQDFDTGDKA